MEQDIKDKEWRAEIVKVSNGFMMRLYSPGEGQTECRVYQESMDSDQDYVDRSHIATMLYEIIEFFGEQGNKHQGGRIMIEIEKPEKQ